MAIFNTEYFSDFAVPSDLHRYKEILDLIYTGVAESPYGNVPFNQEEFELTLRDYFNGRDYDRIVIICWKNNIPVGVLVGICTNSHLFFNIEKAAYELFWYVHPDHRKYRNGKQMVSMFEAWAKHRGCRRVVMGHFNKYHLGKMYERMGYKPFEYSYNKDLV